MLEQAGQIEERNAEIEAKSSEIEQLQQMVETMKQSAALMAEVKEAEDKEKAKALTSIKEKVPQNVLKLQTS